MTLFFFLLVVGAAVVAWIVAGKKGRSSGGWAVLTFFLGGIPLIVLLFLSDKSDGAIAGQAVARSPGTTSTSKSGSLRARVRWVDRSEDIETGHYIVELKGTHLLVEGHGFAIRNFLLDVTDPSDHMPVIALLDWQQADDSVMFVDVTELGHAAPGEYLSIAPWAPVGLSIFPEMTKSSHSGRRRLAANLSLVTDTGDEFWSTTVLFDADLPVPGYVEDREHERADDGLIVRMAVAVAAAAGDINEAELQIISEWSQARIAYLDKDDAERSERAAALNGALKRSVADATSGSLDLGATITRFLTEGSVGGRVEAIELSLAVMRVDGVADQGEMTLINRLAKQFEVDQSWFSGSRDKSISGLTADSATASDYMTLLGIDPKADQATIRRELNEQYDRWASRAVSLSDPERRREAEQMIDTIARARLELLNS